MIIAAGITNKAVRREKLIKSVRIREALFFRETLLKFLEEIRESHANIPSLPIKSGDSRFKEQSPALPMRYNFSRFRNQVFLFLFQPIFCLGFNENRVENLVSSLVLVGSGSKDVFVRS